MNTSKELAKHYKQFYFGKNWTWVNMKETLSNVNWEQATRQVYSFKTILELTYHIHYFVQVALKMLDKNILEGDDSLSFNHPPIESQSNWEQFLQNMWTEAEQFIELLEELPEEKLWEIFGDEKYGTYFRNLQGTIEHGHYHLGQIVLIKKTLQYEQ